MNLKEIIHKVKVKNLKELELEIIKYAESNKLKTVKFRAKCKDFTLNLKFENNQLKVKNKSHTHWDGFDKEKDWVERKEFNIFIVSHS